MFIRFISILFILLCAIFNTTFSNEIAHEIPDMEDTVYTPVDTFLATYENPIDTNTAGDNTITIDGNHDLMIYNDGSGGVGQGTVLSTDSLRALGKTIGGLLLENPGKMVAKEINLYSAETIELLRQNSEFEELHGEEIKAKLNGWAAREQAQLTDEAAVQNDTIPENTQMSSNIDNGILLAGGSGSLDRSTRINFIFVEGNGPANFNWTEERLNYCINQAILAASEMVSAAKFYGIRLRLGISASLASINYEPITEPTGMNYTGVGVNDLDPWRSAAVGVMGANPNLQGLFELNLQLKGLWGMAEGAICFVINCDADFENSQDWAAGWISSLLVCKPYCTVSFNTEDSLIMSHKMMHECLHLFGAADESWFSCYSDSGNCGGSRYGKLLQTNGNCYYCTSDQDSCIMRGATSGKICAYSAHHVGWLDSDGNGGSNVDDMPVDYTGFVTGSYNTGDIFRIWTLDRDFVNAFVISDYNSWRQPNGSRTVHVLGMNYSRVKTAPARYYGRVNDNPEFVFYIATPNSHPALAITDLSSYGPYIEFRATGTGHVNMEVTNTATNEVYSILSGDMISGTNTTYRISAGWLKDGSYLHWSRNWACDGVNGQASGTHIINYGPPGKADMTNLNFNNETKQINADWNLGSWTKNAYLYENSNIVTDISGGFTGASWYNHVGSDYCNVYVENLNPNGSSYSDTLAYVTQPHPPRYIEFSQVNQTVCQPVAVDSISIIPDPKFPNPCEPVTQQINAIAVSCIQPDLQRAENIIGYRVHMGHYIEYPEGSSSYIWKRDSAYVPNYGGSAFDTIYNLDPYAHYFANIATLDRFGGISELGLPIYDSLYVGGYPINVADDPTQPSNEGSKLNQLSYQFAVSQNYPNPFNPQTEISFSLAKSCDVILEVFNIAGQKVATLIDKQMDAGNHAVRWNGRDSNGLSAASGIYLYRLKAGEFADTKKMILLK